MYYAVIDKYYDVYVRDDMKKHRKYHTNIIHCMEGKNRDVTTYIENLPKIPRHCYDYIWSVCPIKK